MPALHATTSLGVQHETLLLRTRSPSGYRNVYYHRNNSAGVPVYVAKVKHNGRLRILRGSRSTRPRDCAEHVVRWYRERFGPAWLDHLRHRKSRVRPWRCHWSPQYGGWLLTVWVDGRAELCSRRRHPDRPLVLRRKEHAELWARSYLAYRYGWGHDRALFRLPSGGQVPPAGVRLAA